MTLFGINEIANAIGVKRETVYKWYQRGKLPKPSATLAIGPVWAARAIQPWIDDQRAA